MPPPFSDKDLQYFSINDFTPGIYRYSRVSITTTYTPSAPVGSAAVAYRCVARPGYGLFPLPRYQIAQTHTATNATQPVCLSIGNMLSLAGRGGAVGDLVTATLTQIGTPETQTVFQITRKPILFLTFNPIPVYTNTLSVSPFFPASTTSWPFMDFGSFKDPNTGLYARTVITTDPITTYQGAGPGRWVTVRGWTTPAGGSGAPESSFGTFNLVSNIACYPRPFYHNYRMGIWQVGASSTVTNNFVSSDNDTLWVSDLQAPTNIVNGGTFNAEMGSLFGTWGSISTGEFVGIYSEGGAVVFYGDLFAPSSVVKLPGVMGTMGMLSRAALTNIGMIYPRFNEGAWIWNGDNTSQKISTQIPDDLFDRTKQAQGFQASPVTQSSMAKLGPWVVFPGNWLLDTTTKSWWLIEDTAVNNFQVWCSSDIQYLFGSVGIAYANAGATATLNTYAWNIGSASSSYRWLSNPLPVTQDSLVSIQLIELVASNETSSPVTVTITPTVPSGQQALQQQNNSQPLVFTIPPSTVAFRASQRLGYSDYNIQLQIDAANTNTALAAPVVHQLNVGYTTTRPAGVQ